MNVVFTRRSAKYWTERNPILRDGEPVVERDTNFVKIGDGVTPYNDLNYLHSPSSGSGGSGEAYDTVDGGAP